MKSTPEGYKPAAGHDWLLPLYDPMLRWVMRENVFKRRLIEDAAIGPRMRVLDLGCGTATLTLMIVRHRPEAQVTGLDGDPRVLALARRKAEAARASIGLDQGLSYELPYADASFDRVVSSLMLHHLSRDEKLRTLREVWRVLAPGGSLHVVDFGPPSGAIGRLLTGLVHHDHRIRDNTEGQLPDLLREAGFTNAAEVGRQRTLVGSLSFYRGSKASA